MDFAYKWVKKQRANYAIAKRNTGNKQAGKEIERKDRQTPQAHFFLLIDKDKYLLEIAKTNNILQTITYEYQYKGTGEKAIRQYLTKEDIDKVLRNIDKMKGKKITIEITPPAKKRKYRSVKTEKAARKELIKRYGKEEYKKIIGLCNEIEEERKAIKKLNMEIEKIEKEIRDRNEKILEKKKEIEDKIIKTENLQNLKKRIKGWY
jgi:hypothetical protein